MNKGTFKLSLGIALVIFSNSAQSQTLQQVWSVPRVGTFWSMQWTNQPPMPFLPDWLPRGAPVYQVVPNGVYIYDDRSVDYELVDAVNQMSMSVSYPLGPGEGGYDTDTNSYPPNPRFTTNDLYLTIQQDPINIGYVDLGLHVVNRNLIYQWVATTDLSLRFGVPPWVPGEWTHGTTADTFNFVYFAPVPESGQKRFFRAAGGDTVVSIDRDRYFPVIKEPCSTNETTTPGVFTVTVNPTVSHSLTVVYSIGGSAINGIDYTNTSSTITLPPFVSSTNIYIQARYDTNVEFQESVILSVALTNGYLVDQAHAAATIWIEDCTNNWFTVVATNVPSPASIDYHSKSNALLLSVNFDTGETNNFALIGTDHLVRNWSGISGILYELKFATIRDTNFVFTNGNAYFGTTDTGRIGVLSWDGTRSNMNWCQLTNEANPVNGLYADRTGVWSNELFAIACSQLGNDATPPGIWRVHSQTNAEQLTRIPTYFLEGMLTVSNSVARYGPWAGKLITGDEQLSTIYAVDTNGNFETYFLGIQPDGFLLIETNQDLYCVNFQDNDQAHSQILKVSRNLLAPYVGDILVTQAGEVPFQPGSQLFIVHWDPSSQQFLMRRIPLPPELGGHLEHATFAPLSIPDI